MAIIDENQRAFRFQVTERVDALLRELRIFSAPNPAKTNWPIGSVLTASRSWKVQPYVGVYAGFVIPEIGSYTYSFSPMISELQLGRYCSVAGSVTIMGPEHPTHWAFTSDLMYHGGTAMMTASRSDAGMDAKSRFRFDPWKAAPVIGNDVWIGDRVTLKRGIKIGDGAVVAANAVVTKDVEPYAIVAGVAASVKRFRFEQRTVERFELLQPWRFPEASISLLPVDQPERFLDALERAISDGAIHESPQATTGLYELIKAGNS